MNAENLVNKKKLIAIIEKLGKAAWRNHTHEKVIPLEAVMLAIESPAQRVSPAELAEEIEEDRRKARAWMWLVEAGKILNEKPDTPKAFKKLIANFEALEKIAGEEREYTRDEIALIIKQELLAQSKEEKP